MIPLLVAWSLLAPTQVQIRSDGDGWSLLRDGKPYVIRGVGGTQRLDELKEVGGNSIRSWGSDQAGKDLEEAHKRGLTMTVGVWLGHKAYFDYANPAQVREQKEKVRAAILQHRAHPALLMWGLGNEMEVAGNDTPELWKAIDDLHVMAKELDPHHPAMTVVAEISPEKIANIKKYAPNLQVLGINSYGGLPSLSKRLREAGWTKPYVVTEFGPVGPWESGKTPWGAAYEQNSSEKARWYLLGYQSTIALDSKCLGSYAFLWGHKQEETPTWFGMFLPTGERTEAVDTMTYLWTGAWPKVRAPKIERFVLNLPSQEAQGGSEVTAEVTAVDPDGDPLTYHWSIRREVEERKFAGEGEKRPDEIAGVVDGLKERTIRFKLPLEKGPYRLYVRVTDGTGRGAAANFPFFVAM